MRLPEQRTERSEACGSFQHYRGKVCGKGGTYSCNLFLTNRFCILHRTECEAHRSALLDSPMVEVR